MKKGVFEQAHGGTIFLDEIGEINPSVQVKLLRVIQEKKFERVGGEKTIEVDVRIIAATNRNMEDEVKAGRFREDLYYRLNVIRIGIPPLRERKEDIPILMTEFLKKFAAENGRTIKGFDSRAKTALLNYSWPGNIRELQSFIQSAVVMSGGEEITLDDLPPALHNSGLSKMITIPLGTTLEEAELMIINQTLAANNGNKTKTAEALGIGRKTLHRKLGLED